MKDKLLKNKALITKADKGSSLIIVYRNDYEQKVLDFIANSGAEKVNTNITTKFQKDHRSTINSYKSLIDTEKKGRLINLNPETSPLRGLINIHKEGTPIRPVVNFRNAPSHRLARMLTDILKTHIPLPNVYNVQNSTQLMNDISQIPFVPELKLASLDISNVYTNIPTKDLINIINNICKNHNIEDTITREIISITNLIITQNHFSSQDKTYVQNNGLAMGVPTSSILSEIYLQFLENTKIFDILKEEKIIGYFRYVDDILIIYNENITDVNQVLKSFNDITPSLTFTLEQEEENKLNFLDILIIKTEDKISFDTYRKKNHLGHHNPKRLVPSSRTEISSHQILHK
jgi:hypothetical protein